MLDTEKKTDERIIYHNKSFMAVVPYAAATPHEIWIIPQRHQAGFNEIKGNEIVDLAQILQKSLNSYYTILNNPDFNYVLMSSPYPLTGVPFFHWYLRIVPRVQIVGGFELGTRISVNSVLPEDSAELLKCK